MATTQQTQTARRNAGKAPKASTARTSAARTASSRTTGRTTARTASTRTATTRASGTRGTTAASTRGSIAKGTTAKSSTAKKTIASAPRKRSTTVATRSRAAGSNQKTRAELYEMAKRRDLPGRSTMGRDELARSLGVR